MKALTILPHGNRLKWKISQFHFICINNNDRLSKRNKLLNARALTERYRTFQQRNSRVEELFSFLVRHFHFRTGT